MKRRIREFARKYGYDIIRFNKNQMGLHPFYDMAKFINSETPMLFDIGANVGQTVKDFKEVFKNGVIHAFEPSPETFGILTNNTSNLTNLHLWNVGVGANPGELLLNEYHLSNTNSFLDMTTMGHTDLIKKTPVKMLTVDGFCVDHHIDRIDVLKIDTEGFELEVFKGACTTFSNNKVGLLFFEVAFTTTHEGMPSFIELYDYVLNNGFELVSIYPVVHRKKMASYTNVLFKHKTY